MESLFIMFFIWIACAVVCYNLANAKGREAGVAAVCGFLFGVFALIYYCAVPKLEKERDE